MNRREFLAITSIPAVSSAAGANQPSTIIDTHAHFYDPSRPGGVPWPPKDDALLYRTVLPDEFRRITAPLGVKGVIKVEASPLVEDNQWVLDLAAKEPVIVGMVGNLEPGKPEFVGNLDRFRKNRKFLGIRCGSLWGRNFASDSMKAEVIADIKRLAEAGLEMDVAGGPPLLAKLVRVTDRVPSLRIVIDHMPFNPPQDPVARKEYQDALRELGTRKQVYCKVSSVLRRSNDQVSTDVASYRPALDELWEVFGVDRLIYGSNWPVSNRIAPYEKVFKVVFDYFTSKGQQAAEKYFWQNAKAAYRYP
jgi:predicted TIM-barrel fold metal-dependent hydrolase